MREQFDKSADFPQPKEAAEPITLASPSEKPLSESAIWCEFMRRTLTEDFLPGGMLDDDLRDAVPAC